MSQYYYEFNVTIGTVYYPVPMLIKAQRRKMDLFIFEFPDAVFSVQGTAEKLDAIDRSMRINGFVLDAMEAQMVERTSVEDR